MKLITPLGRIEVLLDGAPILHSITQLEPIEDLCPDIAARYKIEVDYLPDGKEHLISCCLYPSQPVKGYGESGERLESYGFYDEKETIKVSVGIEADTCYFYSNNGQIVRGNSEYDYDGEFTEKDGLFYISYGILPFTKTSHYVFGVAWIFDCSSEERDVQTWFGADPTITRL